MRGHLKLFHKPPYDVFLERAAEHNVENAHVGVLRRQPLYATDPLFNDHRIPRQIIVNEHIGDLEVDTLGPGLCRNNHPAFWRILSEPRESFLVSSTRFSIDDPDFESPLLEEGLDGCLGFSTTGENNEPPPFRVFPA
jgi:hypothetical protein